MIGAALLFPTVEAPAGWVREVKGPREWLVPPEGNARIVLAPLQARARNSSPPIFFEHVLGLDADRFTRTHAPALVTSAQHYPGLVADLVARFGFERRCFAMYSTSSVIAVMFLQCLDDRWAELRPVFLDVASKVVLPEGVSPPPTTLEPWGEL